MKNLWTPWRIEHVLGETPSSTCIFEPTGAAVSSRQDLLLYRDPDNLILLNRFPYANGHLLVAPIRHVPCITALSVEESGSLFNLVRQATEIVKRHLRPDGFNIGCNIGGPAGAGIEDHLHLHIVPRWHGDHNFICVLAEIRTIPEHLDATFTRLLPDFSALRKRYRR